LIENVWEKIRNHFPEIGILKKWAGERSILSPNNLPAVMPIPGSTVLQIATSVVE
jgi:hypothetical protein